MKALAVVLTMLLFWVDSILLEASAKSADTKSSAKVPGSKAQALFDSSILVKSGAAADDQVSEALIDELKRSVTRLQLEGYPHPYLIAYLCKELERLEIHASFGAINSVDRTHERKVSVDARVGNYKFDNSGERLANAGPVGLRNLEFPTSIDDDYDAVRHALWMLTDRSYKSAIESFESKKAILHQKNIIDLPESYTKCQPLISLQQKLRLNVDEQRWKEVAKQVSAVFRSYPAIISSDVELTARIVTHWFADTEGTLTRQCDPAILVNMNATAQSPDGMEVSDFASSAATVNSDVGLVETDKMIAEANALAQRVTLLATATPLEEDYRGPVLFEKQAAAQFFGQTLSPYLLNTSESLVRSSLGYSHSSESIGRRILPGSVSVIDNPLVHDFNGNPLKGSYLIDDEGVRAQKVTLIENGILKTLCSGRTPGKDVKESNGHWRDGAVFVSQLFVTSSEGLPSNAMYDRLMQIGKDEGLKYVMVVRRISKNCAKWNGHQSEELELTPPNLVYEVSIVDGKEKLIRGARFAHLTPRVWRDVIAVGNDSDAYIVNTPDFGQSLGLSLVTPSVLVSEVDIQRKSNETDTPMILKNPYFEDPKEQHGD